MEGKTVVITGASAGIGAEAARRLAGLGATVAVVGRSPEKTAAVAREIGAEPLVADFARLADVRALADTLLDRYPRIDVLAHNAGVVLSKRIRTEDGHDLMFQVNYLAPFLLTNLLLQRLTTVGPARVISTSSKGHRFGNVDLDDLEGARKRSGMLRYGTTKLQNILFTRELARRTQGTGLTATAFHPGVVATTEINRDTPLIAALVRYRLLGGLVTLEQGAAPLVHLATMPDPETVNGDYYHGLKPNGPVHRQVKDDQLATRLWERTADLLGVPVA
ncbi:SDR family NAD(P)-dependent oxidoreductase [Micromonospora sp. SL1-18]|uniref:SDR family NAD(P)-dependent oxidoreductase n=1 Tax=Micromonospora sp. SL1-18 TaxID=3399128 RepID=UPI003A4D8860